MPAKVTAAAKPKRMSRVERKVLNANEKWEEVLGSAKNKRKKKRRLSWADDKKVGKDLANDESPDKNHTSPKPEDLPSPPARQVITKPFKMSPLLLYKNGKPKPKPGQKRKLSHQKKGGKGGKKTSCKTVVLSKGGSKTSKAKAKMRPRRRVIPVPAVGQNKKPLVKTKTTPSTDGGKSKTAPSVISISETEATSATADCVIC